MCREWFQHPNGALPAYEWDFGDVNPPVQAWAALEVFAIDGGRDIDFISRVFDKLLVNFTWWVNREDAEGNNLFEGGFLGLDNIGPIDRSHLPVGGVLEQSDATGWMGFFAVAMGAMAIILGRSGQRPGQDLALKFLEHFAAITEALDGLAKDKPPLLPALFCGAMSGLLAGITGIGGGLFVASTMLFLGWAPTKRVAATAQSSNFYTAAAAFAAIRASHPALPPALPWWSLAAALGGLLGAWIGSKHLPAKMLRYVLAIILVASGARLALA